MKRYMNLTFFILLVSIFPIGCHKTPRALPSLNTLSDPGSITLYFPRSPQTFDPRKAHTLADQTVATMLMEGLTRIDQTGTYHLALAEQVSISSDKKTYTFRLRPAQWSNGDPITSSDFSYSWKKSLSPDFHAPHVDALYVIRNGKEAKMGQLPLSIVGIETPDPKTLVVTLKHPTPSFLHSLSHPIFFPVNRNIDKTDPDKTNTHAPYVGNGPFVLSMGIGDSTLELKKNMHYWDADTVQLTHIEILSPHLDPHLEMTSSYPFAQATPTLPTSLSELFQNTSGPREWVFPNQWIVVNGAHMPLQNNAFRLALAHAIGHTSSSFFEHKINPISLQEEGSMTASIPMERTEKVEYTEKTEARASLRLTTGLSESELQMTPLSFLYCFNPTNEMLAQTIQMKWNALLGIDVHLEGVEETDFLHRLSKKDYSLSLGDWTTTLNVDSAEPSRSNMFLIPLSYFTLFHSQDKILKGLVLAPQGHIDFKWAYLDEVNR